MVLFFLFFKKKSILGNINTASTLKKNEIFFREQAKRCGTCGKEKQFRQRETRFWSRCKKLTALPRELRNKGRRGVKFDAFDGIQTGSVQTEIALNAWCGGDGGRPLSGE